MEIVTFPNGVKKHRCKHCNSYLSVQTTKATSHLLRHWRERCPARHKIFPETVELKEKATDGSHLIQTQLKGLSEVVELSEVCDFLEVFLDVTNLISGSNYPTVNVFLLELSRIKELIIKQLDPSKKKHMQNMADKMSLKYDKYWDECDLLLCFGSILDPRYKKAMIKYAFESMYPDDDEEEEEETYDNHHRIPLHEQKVTYVLGKFKDLYDEYDKIYGDYRAKGSESSYNATWKQPPSTTIGKRKFDEFLTKTETKGKEKSNLDLYYDEDLYPNDVGFDALAWWKGNEGKFKVSSKMAKDILSIPITNVASESTFSARGRVIDKKKSIHEKGYN